MRALILAGGRSSRWGGYMGVAKHELVVDGETLLARTIRLLRERGVADIVMVGPYDYGVANYAPRRAQDFIDGRLACRPAWNTDGRTVILMGDVWYSDAAMDAIVSGGTEPCLYARFGGSATTGKRYGEIWANSFLPAHHAETERLLREVLRQKARGRIRRAGWWECYCLAHGRLSPLVIANHGDAVEIDDWTEDFDSPADWDRWTARQVDAWRIVRAVE